MKNFQIIFGLIISLSITLNAWEVNTHRAIDKVAIDKANNLTNFMINTQLNVDESYRESHYENYGVSYFDYIMNSRDAMADLGLTFGNRPNYKILIEAGTILEDSLWPLALPGIGIEGRFWNHFYDPQDEGDGYLGSFDALTWAQGENLPQNQYSHTAARDYFVKAFSSETPEERKRFRAKMFVSIGFLMHLFNDMNVPAHTRGDGHNPDPFELWMKGGENYDQPYGFRITGNGFGTNDSSIQAAAEAATAYRFTNFSSPFTDEAYNTGTQFFSKDTIFFSFPRFTWECIQEYKLPKALNIQKPC